MQPSLTLVRDGLLVGRHTVISFNRTLRIPEDGKNYNLPAGLGRLPILRVEDVSTRVPDKWRKEGGLIIPLYQREALYVEFSGVEWRPTIAKVAVGRVNAITGRSHDLELKSGRQDYVVIPVQKWLDGVNSGNGIVRQFVAMPLGEGYTIEAQITDEETHGGFQLAVFDPRQGIFSEPISRKWCSLRPRPRKTEHGEPISRLELNSRSNRPRHDYGEMGIAAGGSIKQQILEDEYGIETWDSDANISLNVHIVNSAVYEELTGHPTPPSPITAEMYAKKGLPWLSHYDETRKTIAGQKIFSKIRSVLQIDKTRGVKLPKSQTVRLSRAPVVVVKTPTIAERVNALSDSINKTYADGNYSECCIHARTRGELLDRYSTEMCSPNECVSIQQLASDSFAVASDCCAQLGKTDDIENYANRALLLHFSEKALSLRLFARFLSERWEDAEDDCYELLRNNPTHEYAIQMKESLARRSLS